MNRNQDRPNAIGLLLRNAFIAAMPRVAAKLFDSYSPEKHYMRGPGPKALSMIGRRLRAETQNITQEPLPERWLALVHSLDHHAQKQSETGQRQASTE